MARPPSNGNGNGNHDAGAVAIASDEQHTSALPAILDEHHDTVLEAWVQGQITGGAYGAARVSEAEVRAETAALLTALQHAVAGGNVTDVTAPAYAEITRLLAAMSKDRARQGYSPTETALAVFSIKPALTTALDAAFAGRPEQMADELRVINDLVDALGMLTFEAYIAGREEVIAGQHQSLLELSTPVVKLWDGIVAVPLIGTLDSGRTQTVMENLLQAIVETESQVAIVDITGVATVDTMVAQHLLKTVAATRLMGADCIISGIRPQIAQTMVHLGVELGEVVTKATLADAFRVALRQIGTGTADAVANQ